MSNNEKKALIINCHQGFLSNPGNFKENNFPGEPGKIKQIGTKNVMEIPLYDGVLKTDMSYSWYGRIATGKS